MPLSLEDAIEIIKTRTQSENGTEKSLMFVIHEFLLELEEKRKNENKTDD